MTNVSNHQQGMIDGIKLWGETCGSQGDCSECPIGSVRGSGTTCQEFAKHFPAKMLSLLTEMHNKGITYYEEYCMRFPMCAQPVETLSRMACRKAIFEGYISCEGGDCVKCWNERYAGDVTVKEEEKDAVAGLTSL